jgi:hypothetical protein
MVDNADAYRPIGELVDAAGVDFRAWVPPGPVSLAYLRSNDLLRMLIGPFGSGKTTTGLVAEAACAVRSPRCLDGVRRYRLLVTRDSYRQLYKTCIPSWQQWFPPTIGQWSGGQDRPAEHRLQLMDDYGPIDFEAQFAAIPEGSVKDWFDGFEPTSIFMNAAPTQPEDVLTYGAGRIGRWPPQRMLPRGVLVDKHIAGDANKTDTDHWYYKLCVENRAVDTGVFDMPGGLDPDAENIDNLPGGRKYYEDMARLNAHRPWWVNINVHNRWGPSRTGQPVYPGYDDRVHCALADFDADPNLELLIGLDAGTAVGGHPAAVFGQVSAGPKVRLVDELYLGRCGPTRFFDALVAHLLDAPHLRACRKIRVWGDPAAFSGADTEGGELTWIEIGEKALGVPIGMPESNELHAFRIPVVEYCLSKMIAPGVPMYQISPRCRLVRSGFNSGYRYKREEKKGVEVEKPTPEKNDPSHVHDANQYLVGGFFGKSLIVNGSRAFRGLDDPARGVRTSPLNFNFDL